jgi:2-polyprenyl-6-methoxyphenol hydroxylase-like FAD-dependent oxidoreductase
MPDIRKPVLIVGGSLVGLATSALLGAHGVDSLVVERHSGTAIHPRAASFHQRTMEIFRSIGIDKKVEEAANLEFVQQGAIMAVQALAGKELAYFQENYNAGVEHLSATPRLFITQIGLEPIIRDRAREYGADIRFGTELVGFSEQDDGIRATICNRADGSTQTVHADYLVAADGARSSIREQVGISLAGRGTFANCVTIYFKSDVRDMIGDRNLSVIYVNHPEFLAFFRFSITADSGFLAVFSTKTPDGGKDTNVSADLSPERLIYFVRTALGAPADWPIEIGNVQSWDASAGWATAFRSGRVLLAGDSAHTMPPTGGFGGNTGIADAHNLAWKLAHVLRGTAGPALLDTYDAERRPNSALVAEQAYARYVARLDPDLPKENLAEELDDAAIELGAVYASAAVIAETADLPATHNPRTGTLLVGSRAPHVWLVRDEDRVSTLDLVQGGFLLLTGSDGGAWGDAAATVAADLGVPVTAVAVGQGGVTDAAGTFHEVYGIEPGGAVLIRPDDIVAWRSVGASEHPVDDLRSAMTTVLAVPASVMS